MNSKRFLISICLAVICSSLAPMAFGQLETHRSHYYRPQRSSKKNRRRIATNSRDAQLLKFMTELRAQGVTAKRREAVSQPFFSVKGRAVAINGESVQVFVYPNTQAAETDASRVSPNGSSVGTSMMSWMAPPHFYRRDNLIALYVGGDTTLIRAMETVLGSQFAGR